MKEVYMTFEEAGRDIDALLARSKSGERLIIVDQNLPLPWHAWELSPIRRSLCDDQSDGWLGSKDCAENPFAQKLIDLQA